MSLLPTTFYHAAEGLYTHLCIFIGPYISYHGGPSPIWAFLNLCISCDGMLPERSLRETRIGTLGTHLDPRANVW